ncbi:MAG: hypothetical protein H0X27_03335 [Caulobacteraceae bacterium]|nr:hypothetical protein [Caulobacteraceae bacterium]
MSKRSVIRLSLAAAAAVAIPIGASAQDFTPIGDRILSDPTFLPLQGQFYGQSGYAYERTDGHVFDSVGADVESRRHTLSTFHQGFSYGVTDDIALNVGIAYGFDGHTRLDAPGGIRDTNQSGFEDPTFGLTWRAIDQRAHPMSLDLFGSYSPDVFSNKTASGTEDASVARGGPAVDFGAALGRETRFFTIRADATGHYYGNSTLDNTTTGATVHTTDYWVPSVGLQTQARLNDRLSVNVGADYNFNGDPRVVNGATGVEHIAQLGDYQDVNVALNVHFVPNALVGSVSYRHEFHDRNTNVFPADPTANTQFDRSTDGVGVQLRYVFK